MNSFTMLRAHVDYYKLDGKDEQVCQFDAGIVVEIVVDDDSSRALARVLREAKRVGRAAWPKNADRMSIHVVQESKSAGVIFNQFGIKRGVK